jgi:hypothetical protein
VSLVYSVEESIPVGTGEMEEAVADVFVASLDKRRQELERRIDVYHAATNM